MSYSYQNPLPGSYGSPYGNQEVFVTNGKKSKNATGAVVGGALVGATAGGLAGYVKNPLVSKSGIATDNFTRNVYETYIKKGSNPLKNAYEQGNEILKKIDKTKTVKDLKDLFNNNKDAAKELCDELKINIDEYFKNINDKNLSANKDIIKKKIKTSNEFKFQNIKNDIQACWKQKGKKFEKATNVSQELFESIKEASKGVKTKVVLKYAAIAGAIGAAIGFITHNVVKAMKAQRQNQSS